MRLLASLLLAVSSPLAAAGALRIGLTPGVSVAEAAAQDLDVKLVEFNDWTTPNIAMDAGDIDVNAIQHKPFLDDIIKVRVYPFADLGVGIAEVSLPEALPGLIGGFSVTVVTMMGSAMAGAAGAGGLGDVAIRYSDRHVDTPVMAMVIAILVVMLCGVQALGDKAVRRLRAR